MSRISVDVSSARIPVLQVGYQGENEVTDVLFDISSWIAEFGEGVAQLRVKRPGNSEEESYVLSLTITDGIALWTVSETDTFNKGNGKVQLSYLVGNIVKKAVIYPYKVGKSIVGADNPVDPFDSWIERSKAWAIGETLDGVVVPETDETYQNNAKYYAEQADILGSAQVVLATEQVTLATEKATLATEKADAASQSEANAAASEAAVNGVSTQLTTRMSAIETEQSVQSARMDTFTSLPEGSTSGNAELADIRVGADGTTYDTAGNAVRGQIGELKSDLTDLQNVTEDILITSNIYDYESVTDGYYVPSTSGIPVVNANFCYSDYIFVKDALKVTISRKNGLGIGSVHCAFYDVNKTYISGVVAGTDTPTIDIPNNVIYLIISISLAHKETYKVELGETATQFSYFTKLIVPKTKKEIDYNLKSANDFVKELYTIGELASEEHHFNFYIPDGEYDIKTLINNHSYLGDFTKGLYVPDYVTIIGNSKENTILKYVSNSANMNISTLNFKGTGGIKNLTVYGEKTRYAIHDDTNPLYAPYYRIVENCKIEGVDCYYGSSYGSGSYSGAIWCFKNVDFISPFSWHSNISFTMPNDITLENCTVKAKIHRSLILKSLASGVINRIHFIGCNIPTIACIEETSGIGLDFVIDGYGNNEIPVESTVEGFIPYFHDFVSVLVANSDLVKGNTVTKSSYLCPKFNGSSKLKKLFGIALEDISNGNYGHIQHKGYILASELGLQDANDGDYVGISNSLPVIVTDETQAIGMIEVMWTTKFVHLFN